MPSAERYAAQKAAAAARGSTPYKDRIARAVERGVTDRARAEGHVRRSVERAARGGAGRFRAKSKDLTVGGRPVGKTTNTRSGRKLRDELRAAKAAGQLVGLRATFDDGTGPKTRLIDGRGAQAQVIADGAALGKGAMAGQGNPNDIVRVGDISITRFDPSILGGSGIDPAQLIDYIDAYGCADWWDAIADIIDADYVVGSR